MSEPNESLKHKRTARILSVACGFLFFAFSFVYLYVFQRNAMEALHYNLSEGRTEYAPFSVALVLSGLLLLLRHGVHAALGLKNKFSSLSYFPSFLLLGVITDIDYSVYQSGIPSHWSWLLPLLLLGFILIALLFKEISHVWTVSESNENIPAVCNTALLLLFGLTTVCIGNDNIHFHHDLAMEKALRDRDYEEARRIGEKVADPSRTLTALRSYAMSKEGTLGEHLFQYPQLYRAEGLLLAPDEKNVLRITPDSLYHYLGGHPRHGERALSFFQRLCVEETGNHTSLEYYLSALLLDKQLPRFVEAFHQLYSVRDSIPRYYKEALFLYEKQHPSIKRTINDEAMEQRWQAYESSKQEYAHEKHIDNRLRKKFSNTYWWYWEF